MYGIVLCIVSQVIDALHCKCIFKIWLVIMSELQTDSQKSKITSYYGIWFCFSNRTKLDWYLKCLYRLVLISRISTERFGYFFRVTDIFSCSIVILMIYRPRSCAARTGPTVSSWKRRSAMTTPWWRFHRYELFVLTRPALTAYLTLTSWWP